jgi:HlyD family secretion protein
MRTCLCSALAVTLFLSLGCDRGEQAIGGSGFIEATSVVVSAEASGRLEMLRVGEGDAIVAGATIGVIDSTTIKLQLEKAHAQRQSAESAIEIARIAIEQAAHDAELSRKEFDRVASLIAKGSANQQQYDQTENRYKQSELARRFAQVTYQARQTDLARIDAEIALLERQLEDCYPTAPVSGIVINKLTEPGELLAPGKPIVEIAKIDTVWVKIYLPAHDLAAVRIRGTVSVDLEDGRSAPLQGEVVWISDEAEFTPKNVQTAEARADLVYAIKVNIANPQGVLKIGMPVMVRFSQ